MFILLACVVYLLDLTHLINNIKLITVQRGVRVHEYDPLVCN